MPPKKTSKKKNHLMQLIAARLIEISLKVDDFIYNKKPISVEAAREYGEEIAKFVPKCQGDVRSSQVIEKLTRVMKNIIEEQSKTPHQDTFIYNQSARTIPSLNDTPKLNSRSTPVETNSLPETTQISTEDKKNTGDKSNKTNTANAITEDLEVDLERTLSNLSLSIIDTFNKDIAYFKQASPLSPKNVNNNSIDKIDVIDLTGPDNNDCTQNTTKITTTFQSTTAINTIGVLQKSSNKETTLIVLTDLGRDLPENHLIKPNILLSLNLPIANDFSATEPFVNGFEALNVGLKTLDDNPIQSNNKKKTQNERDNNKIRKSKEIQKTKRSTGAKRKRKVLNTSNSVPENVQVQNKKKRARSNNKKSDLSDLSWVDNLKYVRVINHMEYDTNVNLEDSFWNYDSLISNWNDYF